MWAGLVGQEEQLGRRGRPGPRTSLSPALPLPALTSTTLKRKGAHSQ